MADHVSCGILMKQIGDEMQKRADNKMRSWDLTMAQAGALLALNDAPEKQLSMKQLEKVLYIAQSTTAGIISRLEQKGLVEGYADEEDKRIKLVRITQAGIDRVLETKRDMTQAEEILLSGLTETEKEMENKNLEVFSKAPVPQAVLKNVLPAMAAMIMVLIYNLADTFFIGQTRNDILIAAVSLVMPVFLIFMAVGTVFGVGGTSVISRALGEGREDYAKKVCSFCMWGCVIVGVVMTVLFLVFMDQILTLAGASPDTMGPAKTYLTIVSLGGVFVIISNCYSNIIRAEGQAGKAMMGQLIGNLLNVVLDPIMILVFDWGVAGAAVATVIGNLFGAVYYILYFLRGNSVLSIHPKDFAVKDKICSGVLAIGIPASLGSLLMSVSQIVVNSQLVNYGDMAVAGMGVAMKVTMITAMLCIGMGQGVQPLLGYCVGAGVWDRFKRVFRFSMLFALAIGVIMTLLCYLFTGSMVQVFLGITGLAWAQPVADLLSLLLVAVLYVYTIRRMESKTKAMAVVR